MSAVSTIVASVAVAMGVVALYRLVDQKTRRVKDLFRESQKRAGADKRGAIIDYERDPADGVYRQKN
ncbi:MAG: hypothetical protein ACE5FO_03810 [Parvularculaceae bacterium]